MHILYHYNRINNIMIFRSFIGPSLFTSQRTVNCAPKRFIMKAQQINNLHSFYADKERFTPSSDNHHHQHQQQLPREDKETHPNENKNSSSSSSSPSNHLKSTILVLPLLVAVITTMSILDTSNERRLKKGIESGLEWCVWGYMGVVCVWSYLDLVC